MVWLTGLTISDVDDELRELDVVVAGAVGFVLAFTFGPVVDCLLVVEVWWSVEDTSTFLGVVVSSSVVV